MSIDELSLKNVEAEKPPTQEHLSAQKLLLRSQNISDIRPAVKSLQQLAYEQNQERSGKGGKEKSVQGIGADLTQIKEQIPKLIEEVNAANNEISLLLKNFPLTVQQIIRLNDLIKKSESQKDLFLALRADLGAIENERRSRALQEYEKDLQAKGIDSIDELTQKFLDALRARNEFIKKHKLSSGMKRRWLKFRKDPLISEYERLEKEVTDLRDLDVNVQQSIKKHLEGTQMYFSTPIVYGVDLIQGRVVKSIDKHLNEDKAQITAERSEKFKEYIEKSESKNAFFEKVARLEVMQEKSELRDFVLSVDTCEEIWSIFQQGYAQKSPSMLELELERLLNSKRINGAPHIPGELGRLMVDVFQILLDLALVDINKTSMQTVALVLQVERDVNEGRYSSNLEAANTWKHYTKNPYLADPIYLAELAKSLNIENQDLYAYYASVMSLGKINAYPDKIDRRKVGERIHMLQTFSPKELGDFDIHLVLSLINDDFIRYTFSSGDKHILRKIQVAYQDHVPNSVQKQIILDLLQSAEDFSLLDNLGSKGTAEADEVAKAEAFNKILKKNAMDYLQDRLLEVEPGQYKQIFTDVFMCQDSELIGQFKEFLVTNVAKFGDKVTDLIVEMINLDAFARDSEQEFGYLAMEDLILRIADNLQTSTFSELLHNKLFDYYKPRLFKLLKSGTNFEVVATVFSLELKFVEELFNAAKQATHLMKELSSVDAEVQISAFLHLAIYGVNARNLPKLITKINDHPGCSKIIRSPIFKANVGLVLNSLLESEDEDIIGRLELLAKIVERIPANLPQSSMQVILQNLDILVNADSHNIEKYIRLIRVMEMDDLPEIQRINRQILVMIFEQDDPEQAYKDIREIFVDYKTPMFVKLFKVFELMHPPQILADKLNQLETLSPVLRRIAKARPGTERNPLPGSALGNPLGPRYNLIKSILYADLVSAQIESGNQELLNFLQQLEAMLPTIEGIEQNKAFDTDKIRDFLRQINIVFRLNINITTNADPKLIIEKLKGGLGIEKSASIRKYIEEALLHPAGFSTIDSLVQHMKNIKQSKSERNAAQIKEKVTFKGRERGIEITENMLLKSVHSAYLDFLFDYGLLAREFLGASADSDRTPIDWDASSIKKTKHTGTLAERNKDAIENSPSFDKENGSVRFGDVILIIDMGDSFQNTTATTNAVYDRRKKELFTTGVWGDQHVGGRGALGSTFISGMIVPKNLRENKGKLDELKYKIAMFGMYVPIFDENGSDLSDTGQPYFSYEEFKKISNSLNNFDEIDLGKISDDTSAKEVIGELSKNSFIKDLYDSDSGVSEGYLLGEHTETVVDNLDEYFPDVSLKTLKRSEYKVMLGLHDTGKVISLRLAGSTASQHKYNSQIVRKILSNSNIESAKAALIVDIVSQDSIGKLFQGNISLEKAATQIRNLAARYGLDPEDLLHDLLIYLSCDAGAYTASTGGKASLEKIFGTRPDGSVDLSKLSPDYDALFQKLKQEVLSPKIIHLEEEYPLVDVLQSVKDPEEIAA